MSMSKAKRRLLVAAVALVLLLLAGVGVVLGLDRHVRSSAQERMLAPEEAAGLDADCILVLGAGITDDGRPKSLLRDRLDRAIELFELGVSDRLLMSGDHGSKDYDEVDAMKRYAAEAGVPGECIVLDHAGFSTYESVYRARDIFGVKRMIVVTQEYHLYRALYLAEKLGVEAWGVAAAPQPSGQLGRDLREILARCKDVLYAWLQPEPTYLGAVLPIRGDG